MDRYSEEHVHQVAGRVIPITMLHELGVDEDHLHRCVQMICQHANLDERGAAALIAHAAADELEGGAMSWDQLIKGAKHIFGAVAPVIRAAARKERMAMPARAERMAPRAQRSAASDVEGAGFSFSDFIKKASSAAKAVRKAAPIAIGLADALGQKKAADYARKGLKIGDQLGFGAGGMALGGYRKRGGIALGGAVLGGRMRSAAVGGMGLGGLALGGLALGGRKA